MKIKYKILTFSFIVILLVLTIITGYQSIVEKHEITHAVINKNFGIRTEIKTDFFSGTATYTYPDNFPEEDRRIIKSLHSINELVTYQFLIFYLLLAPQISGILMILLVLVMRNPKVRK